MSKTDQQPAASPAEILAMRRKPMLDLVATGKAHGIYPYFKAISRSEGTEVEIEGQRLIMLGCNDYLGLAHHPKVKEAAGQAARQWGAGAGGSRFLCGNLTLHQELEERLAAWVGKKGALSYATGFATNLGALSVLLTPADQIFCDRDCHASIIDGCQASRARLTTFAHNDVQSLGSKLDQRREGQEQGLTMIVTEGVFSMSGEAAPLDQLAALKERHPELLIYLDDAHGLGVMGPGGRGSAAHHACTGQMDYIMGTFSKALGSIGGFVASDDLETLDYVRHTSRPLIFSAALPAPNAASVLASLDILEQEPERVRRLWRITGLARERYAQMGLSTVSSDSPIISILLGEDLRAGLFSSLLFAEGVMAPPAVYPAVPRGRALVRTAFMSSHTDAQIERAMEAIGRVARKLGIGGTASS